jgi:CRISPR-associated protein Cmr3
MCPFNPWLQTVGGEATKLARLTFLDDSPDDWPAMPDLNTDICGIRFKLVLTTPALFDRDGTQWLPAGFTEMLNNGIASWSGVLNGVDCHIVAACVGKPQKIGGWGMASNHGKGGPRLLTCHVPAGSVYFCRAKADQLEPIKQLHRAKIGLDTEYGFGHVLVGTW